MAAGASSIGYRRFLVQMVQITLQDDLGRNHIDPFLSSVAMYAGLRKSALRLKAAQAFIPGIYRQTGPLLDLP